MTSSTATGDPASLRGAVLDRLAVRHLDLAADRAEVLRLAAARRSSRRALGVGAAAVVILVLTATVVWFGGEDPDELVADREDAPATTVTRPPRTTASTAPAAASAPDVVPSPTTIAPGPTATTAPAVAAPAPTLAPTTTALVATPLRAEVRAVEPSVAGATTMVEVAWMHADHVGPAPVITIDWGDPAVAAAPLAPSAIDCAGPPRAAGDVSLVPFRYATTGVRTVRVTLEACRDGRPDGERVTVQTTLEVLSPVASDTALRTVVLTAPRTTHEGIALPSLDDASIEIVPDGPGPTRGLAAREPLLDQVSASGPATVVLVAVDDVGTLRLGWPSSPCRSETTLPPPTPDGRPAVLELVSTC